jgi:hypothetical protein
VTTSLPSDVQAVFDRFITTELTTIDKRGQPITWPVTPYYEPGGPCIDVTTGLGYPKKANDAQANPLVALLFSDPTGSGLTDPPTVLVQGSAQVDDADLEANRQRYVRESSIKLPATAKLQPPPAVQMRLLWYYARLYIHIRPERVHVWRKPTEEPEVFGAHMEEVRSGHAEEPDADHAQPRGAATRWDARILELGDRYPTAVLSIVSPDGFPYAVRVPIEVDRQAQRIRLSTIPPGIPLQPGLACLTAHRHNEQFTWQNNFQVRGDLVSQEGGWALVPQKLVGGFEIPRSRAALTGLFIRKTLQYRQTAKREMAKRG